MIPEIILNSSHVVLPGDGAFKFAMEQVKKRNLLNTLNNVLALSLHKGLYHSLPFTVRGQ